MFSGMNHVFGSKKRFHVKRRKKGDICVKKLNIPFESPHGGGACRIQIRHPPSLPQYGGLRGNARDDGRLQLVDT
jgi:hypothetical protein